MFVIKIGGSLLTEKNGFCEPDRGAIKKFASAIQILWPLLKGNLILIIGGGSYGNAIPIKYNLKKSTDQWIPENLMMMTVSMFEWQTIVSKELQQTGVPCYPLQTSAFMISRDGKAEETFIKPLRSLLNLGVLPILAGDLVFDSNKSFIIYSSDNIPELFIDQFELERVVMLTDVPGVYVNDSSGKKYWVKEVTRLNWQSVLEQSGESQKQDVTGGMKNKLTSLLRLAESGVEGLICLGDPDQLYSSVFDKHPAGTLIRKW